MKIARSIALALALCFSLCACGDNSDSIPGKQPTEHTHKYSADVTPPTCTAQGYTTYTCACGDSYIADRVAVAAHDYAETARVEATAVKDGEVTYTCSFCGDSYNERLAATGSSGLTYASNDDGTYTVTGVGTCTDLEIAIPSYYQGKKVTAIGEKAFADMAALTGIRIPDTVVTIGNRAFYGCSGIEEITIPVSVENIGTQIFYKCDSLHTVYYNGQYGSDDNPFLGVANIKKVVFGGTYIPKRICYGLNNIETIEVLSSVTRIGSYPFDGCNNLKAVYIEDLATWCSFDFSWTVLQSPGNLYVNGELVTDLVIPDGVTSIGKYAFGHFNITSVTIPDSVTSIGNRAFVECGKLVSVTLPNGLTKIAERTFAACSSLTSINIPDTVSSIDECAFYACSSLTELIIPDSVTAIGEIAFEDCSNLVSVTIPDSVTTFGYHAFYNCNKLANVYYGGTIEQWNSIAQNSYWKDVNKSNIHCTNGDINS